MSLPDNHTCPVSPMGYLIGDTSQQQAFESPQSSAANDNDINIMVFSVVDNPFRRIPLHHGRFNLLGPFFPGSFFC